MKFLVATLRQVLGGHAKAERRNGSVWGPIAGSNKFQTGTDQPHFANSIAEVEQESQSRVRSS